jgi:hypothetical protein
MEMQLLEARKAKKEVMKREEESGRERKRLVVV